MTLHNEKQNLPLAKVLQTKQEDRTFIRLLSKEQNSKNTNLQSGESSFRVMYYGGATGSIPFRWESRPGTPKHALFSDTSSLPPLTPPPSYQFTTPKKHVSMFQEKGTQKSQKFHTIFSKFAISSRKTNITPISSSSSSSSCSNSSSSYSFTSQKNSAPRSRSPIYFGHNDQEQEPTRASSRHHRSLTFCFGSLNNEGGCKRFQGRRHLEVKSFRKGFLSIFASHGTS